LCRILQITYSDIKQEDVLKDYKEKTVDVSVKKYNFTNRVISEWKEL